MLHTIENDHLICTIESNGAEIRSLKDKITGKEYIWQMDASVWGSSSPVLFPAIGLIKEDKITYKGNDYAMNKHGIIRNNDNLKFSRINDAICSFTLESSEATLKQYPYQFSFTVIFTLVQKRLLMTYSITNKDQVPMQFACGGHTAYSLPLTEGVNLSDYVIEFPEAYDLKASTLGDTGFLSDLKRPIESENGILTLTDSLFNEDALIFANLNCNWVRIRKKNATKGTLVKFMGYPNLALWSKPGADYICVEPWLGLPDHERESTDITQKSTFKTIEPNGAYSIAIETEIE